MDVFDLCAKISLDKSEYEKGLDDAKKSTGGFLGVFGKVGTVASAVGKGIFDVTERVVKVSAAATTAGAAAVSALTTLAVNSYAEYEQLVGGVETLYKDSADKVQEYAAIAYKTAGLSANDYMETATSFAAALVSSLAGDTDAAAELANTAVSDMSDNANKFGTDIESLQTAYNGFAKGQFQLLDNLKLGYGGTKQEMQRLLDDANKLNAAQGKYTKYTIDNYADIVQAVHDIQTEMDITGTTAREASSTIQGSTSAAKAAWSNLVTGVADDNADFILLVNDFVDSVGTAAQNILPRIEIALDGAAKLIEHLVPPIMAKLPALIETVLPKLARSAVNIVQKLVSEIKANAGKLIDSAVQIITVLGNGIYQMLPTVAQSALQIILTMVSKLNENLPQMLDTAGRMLIAFVQGISNHLPDIVKAAGSIIGTLLTYFVNHLPEIVNGALKMGSAIVDGIMQGISAAWDGLVSWFNGIFNSLFGNRSVNVNVNGASSSNRRHAGGLDYVPYNDYVANLHRGEMVLTAREADEYRKNGVQGGTGFVVNQTIYAAKQTPVELAAATRAAFQRARWATV
ncbi:hypothetical protein [uncultured Gemmiger sp.]|uniref:phage tail protein n=1 Tax=uncultured Gemmiger sp. TaxID=1623490 RepID=UPI0025CC6594|nr:hypothetical protein [uncultured Gemmiger sp.]